MKQMLSAEALEGELVFVTGGGTGLGRSMSEMLLKCGAKVAIASRREELVQEEAKKLSKETGGQCFGIGLDVRDAIQVAKVMDAIEEQFQTPITGLINNAAGNFISPTEHLTPKAFDIVCDIVLKGSYNCTLEFGKRCIQKSVSGTVMSIVTTYAFTGSGFVVPSAMAKAGVLSMTRSLAAEWGSKGIRLNAIAPGPFPTKGAWDRLFPESITQHVDPKKRIPLQRFGEHEELANLAAYLMSDFSAYINGEVVVIDGGEWLQGAGEFNGLRAVPDEMWAEIAKKVRGANKQ